ncbi:MAG: matrixin family metalloprotease [Pirellulaceae bacterium]|nr:matrixin family metalloprotease [Pirellulaceae bacterium]
MRRRRGHRLPLLAGLMLLVASSVSTSIRAAVLVFSNQTEQSVYFAITTPGDSPQAYRVAAGDVLPVPVYGQVSVRFNAGRQVVDQPAAANSIQTFRYQDRLELTERRFVEAAVAPEECERASRPVDPSLGQSGKIPVMILVDEDEPAARRVWEKRFRDRFEAASDIFEHHARIRFEVVAVGLWESNDLINDFSLSLREFERGVRIERPAQIAVGFTSQYKKPDEKRVHMGGTRGPLFPYLLVREWPQHIAETERLEVLVHELGHILGAVHSPDQKSVMRPLVGDRQSRARAFRIRFDPLNTLAMYVFCEQLRLGRAGGLSEFTPESLALLSGIYAEMQREFPDDTSAGRYRAIMQQQSRPPVVRAVPHPSR